MAVNYVIEAEVVDIRSDDPNASDSFLVDTNVWLWMTYPLSVGGAQLYQFTEYPDYLNKVLGASGRLLRFELSFAELAHRIEATELEIYKRTHPNAKPKEFRHNLPAERARVVSEVQAAWGQVKSLAQSANLLVDEQLSDAALTRFQTQKLDGYDLFLLEAMSKSGVVQIITDDGDFATVPGIMVFTANHNVIESARSQSKLVGRESDR